MKKVIKDLVYNTEIAEAIEDYSNHLPASDFRNETEVLYRTSKGNYFLYVRGGALSKYREGNGRQWWEGENIIDQTPDEALEWLKIHNRVEAILEFFPGSLGEA